MFHYRGCGLDDIYLQSGYEIVETDEDESVVIQDIVGLHAAIGERLTDSPDSFTGREFRFLRTELGFSQKKLSELFKVDSQTIANWEKGVTAIPQTSDYVLRALYKEVVLEKKSEMARLVESVVDQDRYETDKLCFEKNDDWKVLEVA